MEQAMHQAPSVPICPPPSQLGRSAEEELCQFSLGFLTDAATLTGMTTRCECGHEFHVECLGNMECPTCFEVRGISPTMTFRLSSPARPTVNQTVATSETRGGGSQSSSPLVNEAFKLKFKGVKKGTAACKPDPAQAAAQAVRDATSQDEFLARVWPGSLFHGMGDADAVYQTVKDRLSRIDSDSRSRRRISQDGTFSTSMVVPKPLHGAVRQLCLKHGLHAETILLAMASNVTWMKHQWTRLGTERPEDGGHVPPQSYSIMIMSLGPYGV